MQAKGHRRFDLTYTHKTATTSVVVLVFHTHFRIVLSLALLTAIVAVDLVHGLLLAADVPLDHVGDFSGLFSLGKCLVIQRRASRLGSISSGEGQTDPRKAGRVQ